MGRQGHCREMSLARVGSARSVPATLGLPPLGAGMCAFPIYTAQSLGWSIGSGPWVACGSSFRVFHEDADLVGPAFYAFPAWAAQAARSMTGVLSPVWCAPSPLRGPCLSSRGRWVGAPCVGSGELVSSRSPPGGCQPSRISGSLWLETGSLFAVW